VSAAISYPPQSLRANKVSAAISFNKANSVFIFYFLFFIFSTTLNFD
jgi:hypothetical protein